MLFNLYAELLFKKGVDQINEGVGVNEVQISTIRYADDTVLITDTDAGFQGMLKQVNETCEEFGMRINEKETNKMVIPETQNDL